MRDNMKKELCVDTVKAAASRFPVRDTILHSDRGSQYTSEAFRSELGSAGFDTEPERCGLLLRQRADGELLCHAEERTDLPGFCISPHHGRGQIAGVPICVRLLQPDPGLYSKSRRLATGDLEKDVLTPGSVSGS